ncbi:MAG: hypothetical protein ACO1SV_11050 [Fimbriimonas sp.]
MEVLFPLLIVGFVVIAIIAGYYSHQAAKRRREQLGLLAGELGFEYLPEGLKRDVPTTGFWASLASAFEAGPDVKFLQRFQGFAPFGQGHSPDIDNLIVGRRDGLDWYLFDYTYKVTTSNGKTTTTTTHPFGIVAVRVPLMFPVLSMAQENVFHRIGAKLGMQELTFELEEFNRRYFVKGQDARAAHDLLHPRAIEFLMTHPVRNWQFGGYHLIIHKGGFYDPLEIRRVMEEIQGFLQLVPEYVRQDRSFAPNWASPLD